MKKNGFFTFIFSFIPGAGQMYQGYMKRGLSIMIAFVLLGCGTVECFDLFGLGVILTIIAYSFFDTFNIRNMSIEERENKKDEYVWNNLDGIIPEGFKTKKNKFLGVLLILIGLYCCLLTFLRYMPVDICNTLYYTVRDCGTPFLFAGLLIYIGWKMIKA